MVSLRKSLQLQLLTMWAHHARCLLQVFIAGYSAPGANTGVLEELLATRHEIGAMMGAPSYAHYRARSHRTSP